jgi:hypothetical protein
MSPHEWNKQKGERVPTVHDRYAIARDSLTFGGVNQAMCTAFRAVMG